MPRSSRPSADTVFQKELSGRGLRFAINDDGLYVIEIGGITAKVSLENLRRNYARDTDPAAIARFAEQLSVNFFAEVPDWKTARRNIRYSLEPSDYASGFQETLHELLTEDLVKIFVLTSPDESRISWISNSMISAWGVARDLVIREAEKNMEKIAGETVLEIEDIDDAKLGMLSTAQTPFKASLVLTKKLRTMVKPVFGWPVYVVTPARDFVFVISQNDRSFLGRLGGVVLREFEGSGYPITADVLEVSDQGLTAIGSFAPKSS